MDCHVIVIGGGPAGATAARELAKEGLHVILLESKEFPRSKPCGGGLSEKTINLLPIESTGDISHLIEKEIYQISFIYRYQDRVELDFPQPVIHMTMREKFDQWLLNLAIQASVQVRTNQRVIRVREEQQQVVVTTTLEDYNAPVVIGCDGAFSQVGKFLYNLSCEQGIALEAEIETGNDALAAKDDVELHYGIIPFGYGWIFPKRKHLSIGIGSFSSKVKNLRQYYHSFFRELEIPGDTGLVKGHPIPVVKGVKPRFHTPRTMLAGDAAGLVDPLSGEGIYYAVLSGILAAQTVIEQLKAGNSQPDLSGYTQKIYQQILPELRQAGRLAKIIFAFPPVINKLVQKDPGIARKLVEVIYGNQTYQQLFQYLAGKYTIFRHTQA